MKPLPNRSRQRRSGRLFQHRHSRGLTIMELLVASAIALLMVAGMVTAFKVISDQVAFARAALELSGQLRSGTHRLREDLKHVSAPVRPWLRPSDGLGYFEYIEGTGSDIRQPNDADSAAGDFDDVLMFTARSESEPFVGRFDGQAITSREAEIIYWTQHDDADSDGKWSPDEPITLHRRVLLVRPDLALPNEPLVDFYADNDVSARRVAGGLVANSLSDLTKRENRFAHGSITAPNPPTGFPFNVTTANLDALVQTDTSQGNDVLLSNILAFDVKAYDPLVDVRDDDPNTAVPAGIGDNALLPHDTGYDDIGDDAGNVIGKGGYVDLAYRRYLTAADYPSPSDFSAAGARYDTWPFHYEYDGIDQDGVGGVDQGTNGFDDDNANGVDDVGERETASNVVYPAPLRGIKVTIRVFEPDSQRVRQLSVIQDFVPE